MWPAWSWRNSRFRHDSLHQWSYGQTERDYLPIHLVSSPAFSSYDAMTSYDVIILKLFSISRLMFWKSLVFIPCLSLVYKVLARTRSKCLLNMHHHLFTLIVIAPSLKQGWFLNFLHHGFLVFGIWKLMHKGSMLALCPLRQRMTYLPMRIHTLGKVYLYGVCIPGEDWQSLVSSSDASLSSSGSSLTVISIAQAASWASAYPH